jgi:hypothetical protein
VRVTWPPASDVAPVSVDESWTVSPTAPLVADSCVAIAGLVFATVICSFASAQPVVNALLLLSPA